MPGFELAHVVCYLMNHLSTLFKVYSQKSKHILVLAGVFCCAMNAKYFFFLLGNTFFLGLNTVNEQHKVTWYSKTNKVAF